MDVSSRTRSSISGGEEDAGRHADEVEVLRGFCCENDTGRWSKADDGISGEECSFQQDGLESIAVDFRCLSIHDSVYVCIAYEVVDGVWAMIGNWTS